MFGLSLGHLIILTVIVLLFGHKRLPELGSALGKGLGAFKKGLEGKDSEDFEDSKHSIDSDNAKKHVAIPEHPDDHKQG